MKNIIDRFQGGGRKTIGYALVAMFALAGAETARADWKAWQATSSPAYWDASGNWKVSKSANGPWNFDTSLQTFSVRTVTFQQLETSSGTILRIDRSTASSPIVFQAKDGNSDYGLSVAVDLSIAGYSEAEAYLKIDSGTYTFRSIYIGGKANCKSTIKMTGGALKCASSDSNYYLSLGRYANCNATLIVSSGASYDNIGAFNANTVMGYASGTTATLDVNGGTVTLKGPLMMNYDAGSISSTVNVTGGGVLTLTAFDLRNAGTFGATVTIDGGIVKAYDDNASFLPYNASLNVCAGDAGATIDTGSHDITIGAVLQNKSGEAGVVTFTGGGTITLSGTPSYTGGTTNVAGTVLSLTSAAKGAIVAHDVAVEIPESGATDGTVVFEVTGGTFTQAEVDAMTVTGTDASRYALVLADNGTKVAISDTHKGEYVWNGGNSGAGWRTDGKWSKNGTPGNWYDSTAAVFANAGDSATVDSAVTAASVTFGANATVGGAASLTAPLIVVSNGVSATIAAPTAGPLVKEGKGTLTLSSSRSAATDIAEGTLVMSGSGTTLDWADVTLGTVAGKTAVLKFTDGATLASSPANINLGHDKSGPVGGGVTAELYKDGGNWDVGGRLWIGWDSGDVGKFCHNGGTTTVAGQLRVSSWEGSEGEFTMNDGTVTVNDHLYVGCNLNAVKGVFNMNGGSFTCNGTNFVAYSKNVNPAELHINGGTFTAAGAFMTAMGVNSESIIELNSTDGTPGVLETKGLNLGNGRATFTFNGGELKAIGSLESSGLIANGITVRVAANGGTINANCKAVSIPATLGVAGDTGGMTFKGSGTITLSAAPSYSGKTTVEVGTTLVVPAAIAGANLEFSIPAGLATGIYKVMEVSGGGAFAADVLSAATLPDGANARFYLDNENKEIWCAYSTVASDNIWIGGASGSLNDGANWLSGSVPASGTAIIGNNTAATLTNPEGSAFAALQIVIPSGSAAITISGADLTGITRIENNSTSVAEFQNAVTFAANVNVIQNTGAVKFTGGATGVQLGARTDIHGTYNFTKTGDLVEIANTVVKSDGVYKLLDGTFYKHNADFNVEAGGEVEVKNAKIKHNTAGKRPFGTFNGVFKVNGEFSVSGDTASSYVTHYVCNSGTGTLVANKIHVLSRGTIVPTGLTIMGSGGIYRESTGYVRVYNSGSHTFGAYADWTMYCDSKGGNTGTGNFVFYKHDSTTQTSLTFDTTDYYDNTIGRTITCEAPIGAANANSAAAFKVIVKGKGRFVFANTNSSANHFSGGLTVQDSATVEVKPNALPGKGAVTMNGTSTLLMHTGGAARTGNVTVGASATLKVAESGTVTLGGNLDLADGATLAFNFSADNSAPTLAGTGVSLGSGKRVNVNVSLANGVARLKTGEYNLTTGCNFANDTNLTVTYPQNGQNGMHVVVKDGNLVLKVVSGVMILLK